MGDWNTKKYNVEDQLYKDNMQGAQYMLWFLFLAATFLSSITFLNMLVNLMGETLSDVLANEKTAALSEQIQILSDFALMINLRE